MSCLKGGARKSGKALTAQGDGTVGSTEQVR